MNIPTQCATGLAFYLFHTMVLSRHCLPFPVQLIPNKSGLFQSIGLDSLAGIAVTVAALIVRPWNNNPSSPPWRVDRKERLKSVGVTLALMSLHFASGYLSVVCEYVLYGLAAVGVPMTVAMHRSLQVLLSHLAWVVLGCKVLERSFKGFFGGRALDDDGGGDKVTITTPAAESSDSSTGSASTGREGGLCAEVVMTAEALSSSTVDTTTTHSSSVDLDPAAMPPTSPPPVTQRRRDRWLSMKWRTTWLWWAVGGYYASCWVFACSDVLNQLLLPESLLEGDALAESVVVQMVNPENNDRWAMAVASLAPCVSAPWWEEVLYRGFLLPTLSLWLPLPVSVPLSGVLFGLHHQMPASALPLSALGVAWALLYVLSRNLWVTILVHAMWNSRVFLGSLLGV